MPMGWLKCPGLRAVCGFPAFKGRNIGFVLRFVCFDKLGLRVCLGSI